MQRRLGGPEGGSGGDHVVDDQDALADDRRMRAKRRTVQARGAIEPGLGRVGTLAFEQPATRNAELSRDATGDHLGLIESAAATAATAGGCPGDHVDVGRAHAAGDEPIDQQPGQVVADGPTVAVLVAQQHIARPADERYGGHDGSAGHTGGCGEREPARATEHGSGAFAAGAT